MHPDHDARAIAAMRRDVETWRAIAQAGIQALHEASRCFERQSTQIAALKHEIRQQSEQIATLKEEMRRFTRAQVER